MPYKNFTPTILSSSEVQTYLMNQSVMVFANSAARAAALTAPTEGMTTYLQDTDELEIYNGSAWLRAVVTSDDDDVSIAGSLTVDTDTLRVVASNNRVGIGTTSPAVRTHIYQGDSGNSFNPYVTDLRVESNGNSGISMHTPTNGNAVISHATPSDSGSAVIIFDGINRSLRFCTTNAIERMRIDSLGRVTLPYQPKFLVYSGGFNVAGNVWTDISTLGGAANRVVDYNVGGHWNSTTGLFTAPVDGYYLFYAGGWGNFNGAGNRYAVSFHINAAVGGDWLYISGANTSAVDTPLAMSPVVRYMQAGWYMRTAMFNAVGQQLGTSSHKFYYGGYLLG